MKTAPLKGTKDFLPRETQVRDYLQSTITNVYQKNGFVRIETPIIENIENLMGSEGGDNLNLIFEVLKRGDKLQKALLSGAQLSDIGLRYDLTLPLSRYYAANKEVLPSPFKVIQIGKVYRAERPQKGRMREFMQCDIDIIGDESINAEIELISTTATALSAVGFKSFTVHVNDRRMLNSMLLNFGFEKEDLQSVCVSFDKLDKISADGVINELIQKEFNKTAIDKLSEFLTQGDFSLNKVTGLILQQDAHYAAELSAIIACSKTLSNGNYNIEYSPRLVRGQGYYSGVVFEVTCDGFAGAVGGGGRYDNMIGKFTGEQISAVGFSIGFERIAGIILENNFEVAQNKKRLALIYKNDENFANVLKTAQILQAEYDVCVLQAGKKIAKQLNRIQAQGIDSVCFYESYPNIKQLLGADNG